MPIYNRCYRFRMKPNKAQRQALSRQAGACRWVWNWALARRRDYYAENDKFLSTNQLSAELTVLRKQPETSWLKEVDLQVLQQVLVDLDRAFTNFFQKRARHPKFKSKKTTIPSFRVAQRFVIDSDEVRVPKIGWVKIRQSREVEGDSKSATFKQDCLGHWYVTVVVAFTMPDIALPSPGLDKTVGLDAGLTDFTVLSNGEKQESPKFYRKSQKRLKRAQKVFSRRKKGSNRRQRARVRVAKVHRKIANKRSDFLHKHSTNLIKRFDCICIEDLNVKGLVRTKLAKSFNDCAHGEFRRQLEYKSIWYRKYLVAVGRFYPSTKTCSVCGHVNNDLTLSDRQWICPKCGTSHDRDINAAVNIKVEGMRILAVGQPESLIAQGVDVRPCASRAVDVELRIL